MSGTAVVTVGSNPVPVVLSIRAVAPSQVVLVCSERTVVEAGRVEQLLRGSGVHVDIMVCGVGADFAETYRLLWEGLSSRDVAAPFLLDYTGGTSAMVAVAVALHQRIHLGAGSDRPDLRVYQDDSAGVLVSDAGARLSLRAALTVSEMARVHGFGVNMVARSPSPRVSWGSDRIWREAFLARGRQPRHPAESSVALRRALEALFVPYTDTGCEVRSGTNPPSVWDDGQSGSSRAGKTMELAVLAVILDIDWDEVVFGCEVQYPDPSITDAVTEFDVVVRRGHQVVVVEVKNSLSGVAATAGQRLAAARAVFGGAARVLSVSPRAGRDLDPDARGGLEDLGGKWEPVLASLGRWHRWVLSAERPVEDLAVTGDVILGFLPTASTAVGFSWPAAPSTPLSGAALPQPGRDHYAHVPEQVRSQPLVAGLGGSPLAVGGVLAVTASRATVLGHAGAVRAYRARLGTGTGVKVQTIAGMDAYTVGAVCAQIEPSTLAITPSTKSATAAMAATAEANGHDLLHVDIAGGLALSWRYGQWTHRHQVKWETVLNPQYDTAVDDAWWERLERGEHSNTAVLRAVLRKLPLPEGATVRYSPMPEIPWLAPILVTGSWRSLAVLAPSGVRKADRATMLAWDQHLSSRVGDVGRVLVVLPASEYPIKRQRLWTHLLRPLPSPLFGFWRFSAPGTVEFDKAAVRTWLQ